MSEQVSPLITFYQQGWENYQQAIIKSIASLSSEQLACPVAPRYISIGGLLAHMIDARVSWFAQWMGEGTAELADWEETQEADALAVYNAATLVTMFERTWQVISSAMTRWTSADLAQVIFPPASHQEWLRSREEEEEPPHTRQWIVWHVMEHEIHHGGELSLALGTNGIESFYTW